MNVYGGVADAPVNVINGAVAFWQTEVVPEMVAVGSDVTVRWDVEDLAHGIETRFTIALSRQKLRANQKLAE